MAELYQWKVTCTLCGKDVEYHCNTCGDKLCSACRETHLRSNASSDHAVVPYADRTEPSKTAGVICPTHNGHKCTLWCRTCDEAACTECVTSSAHEGHKFGKIMEKLEAKRNLLQQELQLHSKFVKEWEDELLDLKQKRDTYSGEMNQLNREIKGRADDLCVRVRKAESEQKRSLQLIVQSSNEKFQSHEKVLKSGILQMKEKEKVLEDILRSNESKALLGYLPKDVKLASPPKLNPPVTHIFIPGEVTDRELSESFGQLKSCTVTEKAEASGLTVNKGYKAVQLQENAGVSNLTKSAQKKASHALYAGAMKTPPIIKTLEINSVTSVVCTPSNRTWVYAGRGKFNLLNRYGSIEMIINANCSFNTFSISQKGVIFIPDTENKCIKGATVNSLGILCHTDLIPYGICSLQNGDLLVTSIHDHRVIRYNSNGKVVKELDESLFTYPHFVAENKVNRHMYVTDKSKCNWDAFGKVLAFDEIGRLQYKYSGTNKSPFTPCDLCTDQDGHIFITDFSNNRVHVLDQNGHFLQYILDTGAVLKEPLWIDVDAEGYLWIGENVRGNVQIAKY